jgi:shikimate dehydrogenase
MSQQLDDYVVIGNPIAHSKSPFIHTRFATDTAQGMRYRALLAPLDGFAESVLGFRRTGGVGMNVTVPFKLEAFAMATHLTARAQMAGAVNTLKFEGEQILGDNTDGVGLVSDIVRNANTSLLNKRILLLGAGGAARGVLLPLLAERPQALHIANRSVGKAQQLVALAKAAGIKTDTQVTSSNFSDISDNHAVFDVVINATSAGLSDQAPELSSSVFGPACLAVDMLYGKQPSAFLRMASERHALTRDGLGMLVEQAAEAFYFWRGVRPNTQAVLLEVRNLVAAE